MKTKIVADGPLRFQLAKKSLLSEESIRQKYASRLANTTTAEKRKIKGQMAQELRRRETTATHEPSPTSLW